VNCVSIVIKSPKNARLVVSHVRLQPFEGAFCYKERLLHRAVITPKAKGTSSLIKNAALIREIEHLLLVTFSVST
jgi:hypothetical protein